jgi:hypothetical protein
MSAHHCSICNTFSHRVTLARICVRCAEGRTGDRWCDRCKHSTNSQPMWICPKCAKGRVDDDRCDLCNGFGRTQVAMICRSCAKEIRRAGW